jgi:hypothetical protein
LAGGGSLDTILAGTSIPIDFDFLSIDIDGNDYHIWESLHNYAPKVVCIEHNGTIPHNIEFVQPKNMSVNQGASPLALKKLGKAKGYELVCVNIHNSIFVRESKYSLFGIKNNNLELLWPKEHKFNQIYVLFDGTFVLHGRAMLEWQCVPIHQNKIQVIPKYMRFLRYTKGPFRRFVQRVYLYLYRRKLI